MIQPSAISGVCAFWKTSELSTVRLCSFSHPVRFGHQQPEPVPRRLHQLFPTNRRREKRKDLFHSIFHVTPVGWSQSALTSGSRAPPDWLHWRPGSCLLVLAFHSALQESLAPLHEWRCLSSSETCPGVEQKATWFTSLCLKDPFGLR